MKSNLETRIQRLNSSSLAPREDAPIAYWCGGLAGAAFPFLVLYMISLCGTGADVLVSGEEGNWADDTLAVIAIASPVLAPVVFLVVWGAFLSGSSLGVMLWNASRGRDA